MDDTILCSNSFGEDLPKHCRTIGQKVNRIRNKLQDCSISYRFILVVPVAYAIHVLEESFGFPQWVCTHFSVSFTTSQFRFNNLLFLAISMVLTWIVYRYPGRIVVFFFLAWLSGLFLHNALFHIGGTAYFKDFSPGLISSALIYLPLSLLVANLILRKTSLKKVELLMAFILGGVAHYAFIVVDLYGWDRIVGAITSLG